ncbi:class I SAM-dependent methyltransferase [Pedobacter jeongneungensis]
MKILKAEEAFDKSAKIYEQKFMDVSLYAEPFKVFCNNIPNDNADILDIACGPGNITRYLLANKPGYQILGIDLSPRMLGLASTNNPQARFQLMDCREIDTIKQKFDGITCGFCIPYLTEQEALKLIENASKLLKPNGVLYLSTMVEDGNSRSRYQTSSTGDQVYVHYHRETYLSKGLQTCNFETLDLKRYSANDKDGLTITDLVLVCKIRSSAGPQK